MKTKTNYNLGELAQILNAKLIGDKEQTIEEYYFDTRTIVCPTNGLFITLKGLQKSGAYYLDEAYQKGIRSFLVSSIPAQPKDGANYLLVQDVLVALQMLAKHHRQRFTLPLFGITGSNGKTVVKEWLYQLLWNEYNIARSPKSYNSQLGVPFSVLLIDEHNDLGIFEAGVSQPNEMQALRCILQPTTAILTNIGSAHLENFLDRRSLALEKIQLLEAAQEIIYPADDELIEELISSNPVFDSKRRITFGKSDKATVQLKQYQTINGQSSIDIEISGVLFNIIIPFTDQASIQNALICCASIYSLNKNLNDYKSKFEKLLPIEMRLEIKEAINNSILINDAFNSDLISLKNALDTLAQQSRERKVLVLTDILQSKLADKELYQKTAELVNPYHFTEIVLIGEKISAYKKLFKSYVRAFSSTDDFLRHIQHENIHNEVILLKGSRIFQLEKISDYIEKKSHDTVLEINLEHLEHNIQTYRSLLKPETKIMAMVKANSYGIGSFEIANVLQQMKVNFLGVAIADEGKELRKAGISTPIIVMNPEQHSYATVIDYQLEPEIYTARVLQLFLQKLQEKQISQPFPIHIKLETGMNRLGFKPNQLDELIEILRSTNLVYVRSIFSHLATADIPTEKDYAQQQFGVFNSSYHYITDKIGYYPIKHILNSPGIVAYPQHQYDMVRLGIGMYGYCEYSDFMQKLENVVQFKTVISQINEIEKGETVSYGRRFTAERHSRIATLPVGYADGIRRSLGYGNAKVNINGQLAATVGTICMDMMMVDVTDIDCKAGDEVIIFGENPSLSKFAEWMQTIPYEVLTSISSRVQRVYYQE
ncbi:bifunctional UDP-N-acetylmuramoyl-tripeptide:D-alanyl-D-alanine ligase/alanine racemase [Weeksella virosa]|uniref:Alanine racemase n=1 Tax=Weeksella virosa (strain ATCC 43766 / DSM 16922 / JCM 21250 / CCUG 30538 / CDC 9751 / IAM 14551 / NBRC 16016 / NCTC 11634 / CL345/78) TaxID=865938 RepID=F0P200_WEEVC|nr:bifunctional UDP-N-acetylmuramoyl-tripeptide:D-alanyl-D-alanine ligase/alanine racemase [Weeksella virosa]ADX67710.1 Alanine racemase [Weeksella virosa DSM 16922]MDK7374002.1 bifunctional UDP-N-acetylmuramoyl-tripeptide:D-alanyl-D-alanine ligase/alanine racemase [Weeksella virosa]MDK7674257.1 bifunctional UDP-N-acetylmuramoyl-tripeptide:D-alanyl-D-alanine ligase/alanine racemase [Weeksella virosa]SUP54009.1 Alanine racemase [Weeksella virosa]VEH64663.1 Alanine racemase [Weeksella virosa]